MFIRVPIDTVKPNPYQTRHEMGDVGELARSILAMQGARPETSGLLQVPPARLWDVEAERPLPLDNLDGPDEVWRLLLGELVVVQLAAGHRRLEAFWQLFLEVVAKGGNEDLTYDTFPVELQVLTDEQMADIAWTENAEREDLNPIDEALALRQAMEAFGWTQEQVSQRWRLSRSGVANKLRLLGLPEEAQAAIQAGKIGERHGRVLLSAIARSPTVYEQVAGDVLPQPEPAEDALEKAHELAPKFKRRWAKRRDLEAERCVACAGAIEPVNGQVYNNYWWQTEGKNTYMCTACYRAATDWTPPSVSSAENILQEVVQSQSTKLADVTFPHDVVVGEGDPDIRAAKCMECECRADEGTVCLDKRCAGKKGEYWQSYLATTFLERVRIQFDGLIAPVIHDYTGDDLSANNEVDVALVRDGVCAPGKCERLRFRWAPYMRDGLRPFEDLDYIYNCNHSSSHRACQRRWLQAQRSEDEVEAEKLAKRMERRHREQAKFVEERAVGLVVRALLDRIPGVWCSLARKFDYEIKEGQVAADEYIAVCARRILGHPTVSIYHWSAEDVPELVQKLVDDQLHRLGVTVPATTDDLARRIERIEGFVLGEDSVARQDLTPEQIKGNLDNLDQLAVDLMQLYKDDHLSQDDYERLNERVQALWAKLELARERMAA